MATPRKPSCSSTEAVTPAHLRDLETVLPAMCTFAVVRDDALHCSTRYLRDLVAKGEIRCIRSMKGARVLIPRAEVLRWLAERST